MKSEILMGPLVVCFWNPQNSIRERKGPYKRELASWHQGSGLSRCGAPHK
uniref:Uncharacterized protein n=1 Tax=Rhizophora mucronata TaxID=61149 RepID=A0A2P2QNL1_RHIMU